MRLEQLEYLLAVKRTRSMNQAGSNFHISQQAISHALKELEQELSCTLLYKTNKGSSLTPSGETVAAYGERIFTLIAEMKQQLHPGTLTTSEESISLTAAFSQSAEQLYLPHALSYCYQNCPHLTLNASTYSVLETIRLVSAQQVDIGYLTLDRESIKLLPENTTFVPLQTFYPYVLCHTGTSLAAKTSISINELSQYRITTKASPDTHENYGYKLLAKHNLLSKTTLSSVADSIFIRELVTNNVAIGVFFHIKGLSSTSARIKDDQLYVPIDVKDKFHFGYLLNQAQNPAKVQQLIDILQYLCELRSASYFM